VNAKPQRATGEVIDVRLAGRLFDNRLRGFGCGHMQW
jgi:hypothetical protein